MITNEETISVASSATIPMDKSDVLREIELLKEQKKAEKLELKKQLIEEENQMRKEKATKAMNYLLQHSQKYSSIFLDKLQNNNNFTKEKVNKNLSSSKAKGSPKKKEETIALKFFTGKLYPYQLEGLSWLKLLFENSVNGILADEMGLGKTIQVIALISSLIESNVKGPYLIVAPLSTLSNWMSEFKKFAPKIPVVLFYGSMYDMPYLYPKINKQYFVNGFPTMPVVLTSYQIPLHQSSFLRKFRWQYLIIDEGHRIKNSECQLYGHLDKLNTLNRLLLTGTPLQNNLTELWALLHFLMPQIFTNMQAFSDLFQIGDFNESIKIMKQQKETNIISTIHGVLEPFMLRRLKQDVLKIVPKKEVLVYCPLSELQSDLYKYVLQKNIAKLTGQDQEEDDKENITQERKRRKCFKTSKYYFPKESDDFSEDSPDIVDAMCANINAAPEMKKAIHHQVNLVNRMMLMRKIINHPFTVHCPVVPGTRDIVVSEDVVTKSGKMMVLDAMLSKLKKDGHKVLIFSTFTSVLDFIEDYMTLREYGYCRLDGRVKYATRKEQIEEFNTNPDIFVFLVSTKAGGLGLNLTTADTVILFDRDWNPQNDLQAQDRCHRIGQTRPVVVYSLIAKGTIDEYILNLATAKRRLEKIVIKGKDDFNSVGSLRELEDLLNSVDYKQVIQPNGFVLSDEELTKILDRSDLYKEMELKQ